ncbi:amidohydrolase [bacterium]|nr:amidohydrolase [bacterium]
MKLLLKVLILAAFIMITSCSAVYQGPSADLVVLNARIITLDSQNPEACALAVIGEKIVAIGSKRQISPAIEEGRTKVIDAGGRLLIPGFNDAHLHFLGGSQSLMNLDFRYIDDPLIIQKMVARRVTEVRPGELIRGRGWDHELFPGGVWPTKELLDVVSPDNPVVLSRTDGHSIWVNTYAMRQSGISKNTPVPDGGTIVKDPITGEPTGIFKEAAENLIKVRSAYPLSPTDQHLRAVEALETGLAEARQRGLTSFSHLNMGFELFQQFKDQGRLTSRVTINMWLTDDATRLDEYEHLRSQYPATGDWIRSGYLKDFMDGTLGSGTAFMFEPFSDDSTTSGLAQMSYEELERKVVAADARGFQVGIHAIGTKANHWILNAYERASEINGRRDARHRIEHAQLLTDDDIPRFGELDVIASMQPTHCITDKRFAEKRLGMARCEGAYAWQKLLGTDAHVAFGTDWPVEPLNPMEGIYAAVTRKDRGGEPGEGWYPDQRLSMEKAIELYTAGSAYAEFTEDRKGRLKVGFLADFIILDQDLFVIPAEEIMNTQVMQTIVGGKIVYTSAR